MTDNPPAEPRWRKSSFSGPNGGDCVEMAETADGVLVRNSKYPNSGTVAFTRSELAAWIAGCKAGEFDDLS